jgi:hypothetical protein
VNVLGESRANGTNLVVPAQVSGKFKRWAGVDVSDLPAKVGIFGNNKGTLKLKPGSVSTAV